MFPPVHTVDNKKSSRQRKKAHRNQVVSDHPPLYILHTLVSWTMISTDPKYTIFFKEKSSRKSKVNASKVVYLNSVRLSQKANVELKQQAKQLYGFAVFLFCFCQGLIGDTFQNGPGFRVQQLLPNYCSYSMQSLPTYSGLTHSLAVKPLKPKIL